VEQQQKWLEEAFADMSPSANSSAAVLQPAEQEKTEQQLQWQVDGESPIMAAAAAKGDCRNLLQQQQHQGKDISLQEEQQLQGQQRLWGTLHPQEGGDGLVEPDEAGTGLNSSSSSKGQSGSSSSSSGSLSSMEVHARNGDCSAIAVLAPKTLHDQQQQQPCAAPGEEPTAVSAAHFISMEQDVNGTHNRSGNRSSRYPGDVYGAEQLCRLVCIAPMRQLRQLQLLWYMPFGLMTYYR
jgi:hypothetical protein